MINAVELTRSLIRYETINPPGDERPCAEFLGRLLEQAGFSIDYYPMGENRANLVARIGGVSSTKRPLCFTGHTDVVPLGAAPWTVAPFAADIGDGKLYGRGSTDMKGGVAAFVAAAIELAPKLSATPGLVLVITAGEETGCEGANLLAKLDGALGEAGAIVVAEPTSNRPLVGHKGVLWLEGLTKGVTAHGSTPEKGDNAVYKAARIVGRLATLDLAGGRAFPAGRPTVNIGWLRGGLNINSVPDEARFGVDIRLVPGITEADVMTSLTEIVGADATFTRLSHSASVWTEPSGPWVQSVFAIMREVTGVVTEPAIASYFTDAAALTQAYGHPPTLIIGPGEPDLAHQTDEYCFVRRIEEAKTAFTEIARVWCAI